MLANGAALTELLIACGTYRNGALLAPLVARLIVEEFATPGRHAAHPFSPRRAADGAHPALTGIDLREASQRLLATVAAPGGLPDGREQDIAALLATTFRMLLDPAYDASELRARARRLLQRAPIEENVPALLDLIARQASRERPTR